jgi:dihydropteroate synthase
MFEPKAYYRPLVQQGPQRPAGAQILAGGSCWFTHVEILSRAQAAQIIDAQSLDEDILQRLTCARMPVAGLSMDTVNIMGILNVTPDSFSDGGQFERPDDAIAQAQSMISHGADILDIGGESTRPGAAYVAPELEAARTAPVIAAIRSVSDVPISIDTRKSSVAQAALDAGANLVNDVYAFTHDPKLAEITAAARAPICLMHAQGDPEVMQDNPQYENALLDVYDFLEERIQAAEAHGISREQIVVDPGIGFGKTQAHILQILNGLSLFHSLGCGILLGASRKSFIGALTGEVEASERLAGSISVALAGAAQGVQILRVHDIKETKQALVLWQAVSSGEYSDVP